MSPAPQRVHELVERFERNRDAYRSGQYKEEQVRREFIDPFFKALGWDVDNEHGYSEAYKDVIHEESVKIGSATEAPDYTFRIGGTRKFFVEAKKPSVNLKDDISPAYQLRRYAWSARLPLSVLTDFEEFAVYDCRPKPDKADKPSTARVMYWDYTQYASRWEEIASVFAREEVLKGSFDRYVESAKAMKGTAEVDDAFLESMGQWREALARNFALRNPELSVRELNEAVQRTIDRIVFLRICEDRGVEAYGRLMALLNGEQTYARLLDLYRQADERYNSGLFHFRPEKGRAEAPDELTPSLTVDDKPLKEIIRGLYYPDSPYEFSVIGADILGQVYEQFLGSVIRLTSGHRAVVEQKPEVRKAGGVYYTPTYIVDYIVKNTVGKLLEGKTPREVAGGGEAGGRAKGTQGTGGDVGMGGQGKGGHAGPPLRILDPACGSGSFLLGAYQHLLDWYRDQYIADGAEKWAAGRNPRLHQGTSGDWHLTTTERKRILLAHIYGVDIDPQAVEVTKLNLLLKALEGENEETLTRQLAFFHERALPDLAENIKCGNSLIGPDYYATQQGRLFDEEEMYRVNPFDWQAAFPQAFAAGPGGGRGRGRGEEAGDVRGCRGEEAGASSPLKGETEFPASSPLHGGFDVVIGNPPYGAFFTDTEKFYIKEHYGTYQYRFDSYVYFIEKALSLAKVGGYISFITPELWLKLENNAPLRRLIAQKAGFDLLRICGENVFVSAVVNTIVFRLRKGVHADFLQVEMGGHVWQLPSSAWESADGFVIDYRVRPQVSSLIAKVKSLTRQTLSDYGEAIQGITPYDKYRGQDANLIKRRGFHFKERRDDTCGKWLSGKDVSRYKLQWSGEWLSYGPWLAAPRDPRFFEGPRLLFREVPGAGKRIQATIAEETFYHGHSVTPFKLYADAGIDLKYLLGLVNSRLLSWYGGLTLPNFGKEVFPKLNPQDIKALPIRPINFSDPADRARHDQMVALVERMLALHRQLAAAKTPTAKELLGRQIAATDAQIDRLVYELYGLTEEEIGIVEGRSEV